MPLKDWWRYPPRKTPSEMMVSDDTVTPIVAGSLAWLPAIREPIGDVGDASAASVRNILAEALSKLKREDTMSEPTAVTTTSPPADHRQAIQTVLEEFRATEKSLIEEINTRLTELANTQHAIVSYQALFASLAEPVAPAKLSPIPLTTPSAPASVPPAPEVIEPPAAVQSVPPVPAAATVAS